MAGQSSSVGDLLSISPGFAFPGAFLATAAKFSLRRSLGTNRNLGFYGNVAAQSGGFAQSEGGGRYEGSNFKELLKEKLY